MIDYGKIRSTVQPDPIEIDDCSVYVNTDIAEISVEYDCETQTEYEFHQIRYDKNEYIKLISEQNDILQAEISDTQLALCEIYEGMI